MECKAKAKEEAKLQVAICKMESAKLEPILMVDEKTMPIRAMLAGSFYCCLPQFEFIR